jgi:hypothetical protein
MDPFRPVGTTGNAGATQHTIPQDQGRVRAAVNRVNANIARAAERQSGEAEAVQQRSRNTAAAQSQIFGSVNARQAQQARGQHQDSNEKLNVKVFTEDDQSKLKSAKNVFVAGFSSQGGGHTERMFKPLTAAVGKGDAIVVVLPPHWEVDTGNEAKMLAKYKAQYSDKGIDVVTVQSDKAIWGFYEPDGPSDNFRILEEFANKPKRDNSQIPLFGPARGAEAEKGQAFTHHAIMQQIVDIVDDKDKITVFEDMDPYLAKAADKVGIPKPHIVGQSNHLLLLDADEHFGKRSDAFLVKANGNGYIGNAATVEFNKEVNTTAPLNESLDNLGIRPQDKALDVRQKMVELLLEHGRKHDLNSKATVSMAGCVMVSPGATKESIDRGVYLYLNKYTDPLAQHIRARLNGEGTPEQAAAYKSAIFVVCGAGTFDPNSNHTANAMHVGQAANFDAVTAAGFGTSSEMHYLISNDAYQGNLLLMPVERQHEQEANAAVLLPDALGERRDRVATAKNIDDLRSKLDDMVVNKATTNAELGNSTMNALYQATYKKGPLAIDKAVERLTTKAGMTAVESRLLQDNTERANDPDRKALRRINKAMIPALMALSEGKATLDIRMTAKVDSKRVTVRELINTLSDPDKASELMDADLHGERAKSHCANCVTSLEGLMAIESGSDRRQAAKELLRGEYANDVYTLGY